MYVNVDEYSSFIYYSSYINTVHHTYELIWICIPNYDKRADVSDVNKFLRFCVWALIRYQEYDGLSSLLYIVSKKPCHKSSNKENSICTKNI